MKSRGNLTHRDNTKEQFNKVLTGVMTDDSDDADIDNEFDENITTLQPVKSKKLSRRVNERSANRPSNV